MTEAIREWYAAAPKVWRACWCDSEDGNVYAATDRHGVKLSLMVCDPCGTARVTRYLRDDAITDLYAHRYRALFDNDGPGALFAGQLAHGVGVRKYLGIGKVGCVVDYGSGAGGFLAAFDDCDRLVGVEPGEYARHGVDKGIAMEIVEDSLSLDVGIADYVFAMHTIEHRVDLRRALRDHMRLLKPGGRLVIEVPDLGTYKANYQTLSRYLQTPHYWQFTTETLIAAAASVGLIPLRSAAGTVVEFAIGVGETESDKLLKEGGAICTGRF